MQIMQIMQKNKMGKKIYAKAVIAFLLTFLLCTVIGFITIQSKMNNEKLQIEAIIHENSFMMNEVISNQLYKTQALAALVIQGDGVVSGFQRVASLLAADMPALAAFLLAPDGIVTEVFPLDYTEVMGLNFFNVDDHDGNREAIQARDTGMLVMGGPFILRNGNMGLTGRFPVYIDTNEEENKFWGLVTVSLNFPEALDGTGLSLLEHKGYSYELWRINPDNNERQVIASGSKDYKNTSYIEKPVNILNAEWYLRIYPVRSWYKYPETWLLFLVALSISLFIAFVMQSVKQKELELTKSKIAVMLTQIQPHFLHNALSAIGQLCDENPARAKKAVSDFSAYLRCNMESLSNEGLISIEKEINHVKGYLELEKAIYDDALNVFYYIEASGFELPPLTIQPIVENAVKHGIGEKENGGTVTISVREADKEYNIAVLDDGAGFDVNNQNYDKNKHIGIENVRKRIKEQCGGTLEISSEVGAGTKAIITIPKNNPEKQSRKIIPKNNPEK